MFVVFCSAKFDSSDNRCDLPPILNVVLLDCGVCDRVCGLGASGERVQAKGKRVVDQRQNLQNPMIGERV
jgi:hypothetical protein